MTRRLVSCIVLHCDGCGAALGCDGEMHFDSEPHMAGAATDLGWTTDGQDRWHCTDCPALEAAEPAVVIEGQESFDLRDDPLERMLRRVGLMPWRA